MAEKNAKISLNEVDEAKFKIRFLRLFLLDAWDNYEDEKYQHGHKRFWEMVRTCRVFNNREFMTLVHVSYDDWREWIKCEISFEDKILDRLFIIAKFIHDYFDCNLKAFSCFLNNDKELKKIVVGAKVGEVDNESLKQWGEEHREEIRGKIKYLEDQLKKLENIYSSQA